MLVRDRAECEGCPLREDGRKPFVPDLIREQARLFLVGQNPGVEEEREGQPFVGKAGLALESQYLRQAGLTREDVSLGNAIRCRFKRSNSLPEVRSTVMKAAVQHCRRHWRQPEGARALVSMGDHALLSTAGVPSSSEWRGWLLPQVGTHVKHLSSVWTPAPREVPVFATMHPARVFREPGFRIPLLADWRKLSRFLTGRWPRPMPPIQHGPLTEPLLVSQAAFDTEYDGQTLTRYSLAWDGQVRVVEAADGGFDAPWTTFVMQHAVADYQWLRGLTGQAEPAYEDVMYAHAVLWAGFPHSLEYLGSIYASTNRWKHLSQSNPVVYSGADAWGTWECWQALQGELAKDPQSLEVYRTQLHPLVPIIDRAHRHGLRVNQARAQQVAGELANRVERATRRAQAAVGWPINLGSTQQVGVELYGVQGLQTKKRR